MRLIDADALLSDIERTIEASGCVNHEGEMMDCVRYAPTIAAAPVVRGEWVPFEEQYFFTIFDGIQCSVCGSKHNPELAREYNYCPNCSAKMEDE